MNVMIFAFLIMFTFNFYQACAMDALLKKQKDIAIKQFNAAQERASKSKMTGKELLKAQIAQKEQLIQNLRNERDAKYRTIISAPKEVSDKIEQEEDSLKALRTQLEQVIQQEKIIGANQKMNEQKALEQAIKATRERKQLLEGDSNIRRKFENLDIVVKQLKKEDAIENALEKRLIQITRGEATAGQKSENEVLLEAKIAVQENLIVALEKIVEEKSPQIEEAKAVLPKKRTELEDLKRQLEEVRRK